MAGFYMKRNTGLKWVKENLAVACENNFPVVFLQ